MSSFPYELPDPDAFYPLVWEIVRQIPTAQVATYGQIAGMMPTPEGIADADFARLGARWVGEAMNAISSVDEPTVPWHRVINSKGGISLSPESISAALQRGRLRAENITFDVKERVDFEMFGWNGDNLDAGWLTHYGLRPPRPLRKRDEKSDPDTPAQMSLF